MQELVNTLFCGGTHTSQIPWSCEGMSQSTIFEELEKTQHVGQLLGEDALDPQ